MTLVPYSKNQKREFHQKVQKCIETDTIPIEQIYPSPGWRNISNLGWHYVYERGIVGQDDSLIHSVDGKYQLQIKHELLGKENVFKEILGMMRICEDGRTSTSLFLFVHASVLTTVFEKAGYPIHFVYGITGVTNSRKTSLALAMAKIFDRDKMVADAEFATATECGIEKTLSTYKDAVVIIDDFKPGVNRTQQIMMDKKLDQLVRFYGNRVSKKRMTDFCSESNKKYFPINGACVLTMEVVTGIFSSISRMYLTELHSDDVNNTILSYYQKNIWILPTHLYDFLDWITFNFDEVVKFISKNVEEFRKKISFEIARYAEMYAIMITTAMLFSEYAVTKGFWDNNNKQGFMLYIERVLKMEFQSMQARLRKCDKAYIALEALKEGITSRKISTVFLTKDNCSQRYECYVDEKYIYIRAKYLKKVVNEYCKIYGENCEIITEDELIGLLERKGVLHIDEKYGKYERSKKLPIQRGNTLRYLYINKEKVIESTE